MKLITESAEQVEFLTETVEGKKTHFIEGVFLQADIVNRNKRLYPKKVMEKAVENYRKDYIEQKRAYGEPHHPTDRLTVNADAASHIILSLAEQGNNYIGKAKILGTPAGNTIKVLLDEGCQLAVSSRGAASVKRNEKGYSEVQEDFFLATAADIVTDPSAPSAFVNGIMENAEWICENGVWSVMQIESAQDLIHATPKADLEAAKLRVFADFMTKLGMNIRIQ